MIQVLVWVRAFAGVVVKHGFLLPVAVDTSSADGGDNILVLWRRLRLYLDVCMAHGLLVRWRRVSGTSSPWGDLWAWISWAAVDTEFWLVTMVVIPPPMVHRDHRQDVVMMRVSQTGAALRALAGVTAPNGNGDGCDDEHDQHQWHYQVERVDSTHHRLQASGGTALTHIFLPEPSLQPVTAKRQRHRVKKNIAKMIQDNAQLHLCRM